MKFNETQLSDIYDVLVLFAGASIYEKDSFIQSHLDSVTPCREWRFCGQFGFGGKYRIETNRIDYYSEDKTVEREKLKDIVNDKLFKLV